jgi:hypothetical protein
MKETDNYSTNYISSTYYQRIVELRMISNKLATELETSTDPETEKRFKKNVSLLAKELAPKYQRRSDKKVPDELDEMDNYNLSSLTVNKCRELLRDFNDLAEKLGIISSANSEYEIEERGAVKKDES